MPEPVKAVEVMEEVSAIIVTLADTVDNEAAEEVDCAEDESTRETSRRRGRTILEGKTRASQGVQEGDMMVDGKNARRNRWVEAKSEA